MPFAIQIDSNAKAVIAELQRLPSNIMAAMRATLNDQNARTLADLTFNRMGYPSNGPVVPNGLRRITSTAVRSLRYTPAINDGDNAVSSTLGSNLTYVQAQEFGFTGTVFVRAHARRIFKYGKPRSVRFINPTTKQTETTTRRSRKTTGGTTVRAHTMKMNLPARHMIRDTLAQRIPEYGAAISATIFNTWKDAIAAARNGAVENLGGSGI